MRPIRFAAALAGLSIALVAAGAIAQSADPFRWLEEVESERSLVWVSLENARSEPVLTGDARFADLQADALAVLSAKDRIAQPDFIGDHIYNFWQDADHVRGVWRRTTLDSYRSADPRWETVLDLDALSAAENANWIWKGASCRSPAYDRCLVRLSNGGKDAVEVREFSPDGKGFVAGGFRLAEGKQNIDWLDADTLILTRDWGPGSLTDSGYGRIVKILRRDQTLDQARTVFEADARHVSASPQVYHDAHGGRLVLIGDGVDFFNTDWYVLDDQQRAQRLMLPTRSNVHGLINGKLIVSLQQDWTWQGKTFASGALLAVDTAGMLAHQFDDKPVRASTLDEPIVETLYEPRDRQALDRDQIAVTDSRVVAVLYNNVRGSLVTFNQIKGSWLMQRYLGLDNASVNIVSTADKGDDVFYTEEGFTTPTRLMFGEGATPMGRPVKTLPARFDADNLIVEQKQATSKDGTLIPYFIVRRKDLPMDGTAPTLLHAYGGFQLSKLPVYDPIVGKLWLERGGVYVVANIRGGGEFGPAWHEAALKQNRQRAYDDYFAVAEALIADHVTSPRHLGAYGRSNGGLLMGVAMTQRPDLWNAVVVESPLLDMMRYTKLPAGASWIGEYGDPDVPEEAAWIAAYSPYQNLKPGVKYPLAYITTSTKDDRVHPGHARKFAARLAELGQPYLYYENLDGGHANGADPKANARRWAMHYVYLSRQLMD
ncbi:MAG: prolyl oligopeptidase family serine peptidase [Caulobacter sp.]|nr:prolyl oligopeptidase family serine peptidase [Caulobacter sp.]